MEKSLVNYESIMRIRTKTYFFIALLISINSFSQAIVKDYTEILYSTPPTAGIITFPKYPEFSQDTSLELKLYDLSGTLEKSTKVSLTKENTSIVWDTNQEGSKLATGVYILEVIGNTQRIKNRLILDCGCRE